LLHNLTKQFDDITSDPPKNNGCIGSVEEE